MLYLYCDDCIGSELSVTVSLSDSSCYVTQDGYSGSEYVHAEAIDLTVSIPSAINCDLPVRIKRTVDSQFSSIGGGWSSTNIDYFTITIPAGNTSANQIGLECRHLITAVEFTDEQNYFYELAAQATIPTCGDQPPGCDLSIDSVVVTPPSQLNESDGSITFTVGGTTGSTWTGRLNGGTPVVQGDSFTGLTAGEYQIVINEGGCSASLTVTVTEGTFTSSPFNTIIPKNFVASENPIILTLSTAIKDGSALPAIMTLTVANLPENNYKVSFRLSSPVDYDVDFYAKYLPNKTSYFFANEVRNASDVFVKNNTVNEVAASLAQSLQDDIIINRAYYINVNSNVITLVSKVASDRYTLSTNNVYMTNSGGTVGVTTGVTFAVTQAGTDFYEGAIVDDYNLFCEVYAPSRNVQYGENLSAVQFNRITDLILPYSANNYHKFDFANICKSFVRTSKPDFEFTGFTTITTYMQPFYFKYGEFYPIVPNTNTKKKNYKGVSNNVWVANAALDYEVANDMTTYTGVTISTFLRNVPFLTNAPARKLSSKRQRELLYFIVPKDLGQGILDVRGYITFWDGSTLPLQQFITISNNAFNFGGAFCINVSFDQLGLDGIETTYNKLIRQLDISVYSGDGARNLTVSKTYVYELEERVNRVGLAWLNKLGTFDTFDFAGLSEGSITREDKDYTIVRDINFDGSLNYGFKYNSTYDTKAVKRITVNSGWIDLSTFNWLLELLNSNEIYIYSAPYDNYVNVSGFKYAASSNDTLFNVELELSYTIQENNISV